MAGHACLPACLCACCLCLPHTTTLLPPCYCRRDMQAASLWLSLIHFFLHISFCLVPPLISIMRRRRRRKTCTCSCVWHGVGKKEGRKFWKEGPGRHGAGRANRAEQDDKEDDRRQREGMAVVRHCGQAAGAHVAFLTFLVLQMIRHTPLPPMRPSVLYSCSTACLCLPLFPFWPCRPAHPCAAMPACPLQCMGKMPSCSIVVGLQTLFLWKVCICLSSISRLGSPLIILCAPAACLHTLPQHSPAKLLHTT